MINKIKKAFVGAVLNSDTFKSTLENIVSEEVEACVESSDDLITDEKLDRTLRDLGYDYDIPDKDEVREIANEELDCANFVDRDELESDVKTYFKEFINEDNNFRVPIEVLDTQLKQHLKKFCEQSVTSLSEHLTAYVKLLEKAGDDVDPWQDGIANNKTSFNTPPVNSWTTKPFTGIIAQ